MRALIKSLSAPDRKAPPYEIEEVRQPDGTIEHNLTNLRAPFQIVIEIESSGEVSEEEQVLIEELFRAGREVRVDFSG